jgi:hypothetical protein
LGGLYFFKRTSMKKYGRYGTDTVQSDTEIRYVTGVYVIDPVPYPSPCLVSNSKRKDRLAAVSPKSDQAF